ALGDLVAGASLGRLGGLRTAALEGRDDVAERLHDLGQRADDLVELVQAAAGRVRAAQRLEVRLAGAEGVLAAEARLEVGQRLGDALQAGADVLDEVVNTNRGMRGRHGGYLLGLLEPRRRTPSA